MANQFEGKRYTTIVHMQSIYNCIENKTYEHPPKYAVFDNEKNIEVIIPGFNPRCYEDIYKKAMELNKKLEESQK